MLAPTPELVAAVQAAALYPRDPWGQRRKMVIAAMSGVASFNDITVLFLQSLRNNTFLLPDNTTSNLARHTIIFGTAVEAHQACMALQPLYGHQCVYDAASQSNQLAKERSHALMGSLPYWALGYTRIHIIADILPLGVDVAFTDTDILYVRNPVPYWIKLGGDLYTICEKCRKFPDSGGLPVDPAHMMWHNIGILYMRSTPAVMKLVMDWMYAMVDHLSNKGDGQRFDPWDQLTLRQVISRPNLGFEPSQFTYNILNPEAFTAMCHGTCGCDLQGLPMDVESDIRLLDEGVRCPERLVRKWYTYHAACFAGHAGGQKIKAMKRALADYEAAVGPLGSLSDPIPW